jgi:hypothetical protein
MLLAACQSGSFSKQGAANPATVSGAGGSPIPAMAMTRFSDVPLPQGIKEDLERSYVFESRTLQVGRMVYSVDRRVTSVAQFYIQEAPKYGWQLTSVLQAEGAQLSFEKPGKRMWVSVSEGGFFGRGSRLVIHVVPDESPAEGRIDTLGGRR